ncbi:MAG: universal stress protein [Alphaproteobacteria bacterium]|nr:universal stress protein [Alphaproteobacteria bacterium]MCB9796858.1 universal stress protein [Alphaproteobacteria bacterium]
MTALTAPVLLAIDFSPCSMLLTQEAGRMAAALGTRVLALHVAELPEGMSWEQSFVPRGKAPTTVGRFLEDDAARRFPVYLDELARMGVDGEVRMERGEVASSILEVAALVQPRLIVVGTHGRSGFERVLMGSVSEEVVRGAHAPVLTLRTHWREGCEAATCGTCMADLDPAQQELLRAATLTGQARFGSL